MPRGKSFSDAVKQDVADRINGAEDKKSETRAIVNELGISAYTAGDWARQFRKKTRKVKRKVMVSQPKENTRVSVLEAENKGLRETIDRLRGLLLDEILRNKQM